MLRDIVIVFVAAVPRHGRRVGRGRGRAAAAVTLARLLPDPRRGLFDLVELFYEFVEFRLRAEAESVHGVGPHVRPLPELLTGLGEGHVGGDGGVDDGLGALHRDDPVEGAGGVVEEGDRHGRARGGNPRSLRLRVDVEHMCLAREDRLLTWNNDQFIPEPIKMPKPRIAISANLQSTSISTYPL